MTMKPENDPTGPIDMDTCEPWEETNENEEEQKHLKGDNHHEEEDEPKHQQQQQQVIKKKEYTKTSSRPFGSAFKHLIKTKRLSILLKRITKHHVDHGNTTDSDMSMSSGPTTFDHAEDPTTMIENNEPPVFHYKEGIKSPLLKNVDTSLYDNRLLSPSIVVDQQQQQQQQQHHHQLGINNKQRQHQQPSFRHYLPMDGMVVAL
ncbi:unnamed protein product [Cylindrotheca closterium]|uniref:Uncharacterized protein n=1 Tax=Cylindrotheca closterium TaxID=2856 RepID=A0AAD2JJG9_9STRA|nr:unnamed protein product [Cylindrotheca closterium]